MERALPGICCGERSSKKALTRGATPEHIIDAALESIAYTKTKDVLDAMQADTKIKSSLAG